MFWLVLAGMTGLAALAVLWPLSRRRAEFGRPAGESAFYRAQLREIERDVERGQLPADEAASARTEAARRLIAADAAETAEALAPGSPRRRRVAALAILVCVPAISLGVYLSLGQPETPDAPLAQRKADPSSPEAIQFAIAKIEARLAAKPDDQRGWEVLAPVYMRLGRFDDAVGAYKQLLRLKGENDPNLLSAYGEALLAAANGVVTSEAHAVFDAALKIDPRTPMARFYSGLAAEQDGDVAKARAIYEELEPKAKGEAPWMIGLRARLEALRAGKPLETPAAQARPNFSPEQLTMIRGMVSGLAQRLADKGGSAEEWARLVRAYSVLSEPEKAKIALADARKALASDATALGNLDALAHELGLGS
jgi:cytochrome c-type biogenesis protein CcmH